MAWLAVDKDSTEWIFNERPIRRYDSWYNVYHKNGNPIGDMVLLPKGTIKKIIGKELVWKDNPVEF